MWEKKDEKKGEISCPPMLWHLTWWCAHRRQTQMTVLWNCLISCVCNVVISLAQRLLFNSVPYSSQDSILLLLALSQCFCRELKNSNSLLKIITLFVQPILRLLRMLDASRLVAFLFCWCNDRVLLELFSVSFQCGSISHSTVCSRSISVYDFFEAKPAAVFVRDASHVCQIPTKVSI